MGSGAGDRGPGVGGRGRGRQHRFVRHPPVRDAAERRSEWIRSFEGVLSVVCVAMPIVTKSVNQVGRACKRKCQFLQIIELHFTGGPGGRNIG